MTPLFEFELDPGDVLLRADVGVGSLSFVVLAGAAEAEDAVNTMSVFAVRSITLNVQALVLESSTSVASCLYAVAAL